jgi:hypothetical protein
VFYIGEFSPNFDLKDIISTYTKDFFHLKKNGKKLPAFSKKKYL